MIFSKATIVLITFLALMATPGCIDHAARQTQPSSVAGSEAATGKPPTPSRIVSMSPNLTEIVYALGAADRIVGVDEYSTFPPSMKNAPKMGSYLAPNLEAIIAAKPDIVLILKSDTKLKELLDGTGLKSESFGNNTVADILDSIKRLGVILGGDSAAMAPVIVGAFEDTKSQLAVDLQDFPKTKVVLVAGRNPGRLQDIYVAGSSSFLGELVTMAGGENVFGNLNLAWPQVGVEAIVATDPDVIIDSTLSKGATDEEFKALEHDWDALPSLRAVKNHRIIVPRDGWWQIPGPYMDCTLLLLAHWLHPEVFPNEFPCTAMGDNWQSVHHE